MNRYIDANLPDSFAEESLKTALSWCKDGHTFTVLGVNSAGVSPFLKFFSTRVPAHVVHLDTFELSEFTKEAFLDLLFYKISGKKKQHATFADAKLACEVLLKKEKRIIIIVNKFDALHKEFSQEFLGNLRTLCHGNDGKISFIFGVTRPYIEYAPEAISGSNMHMYSRYLYFPLYNEADIIALLTLYSPELLKKPNLTDAIRISGGHIQLLQLMLRSEMPNTLKHDPYIRLLLKNIYEDQSPVKRKIMKRIAEGKVVEDDIHLSRLGLVKNKKLFSPLFASYLAEAKLYHLSPKERKLFQLLKNSNGKILSKEKIFSVVWSDDRDGATDWALDSTIYRLRKHPYLTERNFSIKNHKKLGYQLIRE